MCFSPRSLVIWTLFPRSRGLRQSLVWCRLRSLRNCLFFFWEMAFRNMLHFQFFAWFDNRYISYVSHGGFGTFHHKSASEWTSDPARASALVKRTLFHSPSTGSWLSWCRLRNTRKLASSGYDFRCLSTCSSSAAVTCSMSVCRLRSTKIEIYCETASGHVPVFSSPGSTVATRTCASQRRLLERFLFFFVQVHSGFSGRFSSPC